MHLLVTRVWSSWRDHEQNVKIQSLTWRMSVCACNKHHVSVAAVRATDEKLERVKNRFPEIGVRSTEHTHTFLSSSFFCLQFYNPTPFQCRLCCRLLLLIYSFIIYLFNTVSVRADQWTSRILDQLDGSDERWSPLWPVSSRSHGIQTWTTYVSYRA